MYLGIPASELITLGIKATILSLVSYYASNYMLEMINPRDKKTRENVKKILESVGVNEDLELTEHEIDIATQVVNPNNIKVQWKDIGGLETIIQTIQTDVISLIKNKEIMRSSHYCRLPKGILLYGPPGCGKTMIAQAAAKQANIRFINLNISTLTSKWYGESVKLASAVFSLAKKISPCIIFIDEIDTFLRSRSMNDHECTVLLKGTFLSQWDGFASDPDNRVILIGATNKKFAIDDAILSRMELQFEVKLPNLKQRKSILSKMFKSINVDNDVKVDEIANLTNSFSGRDIDDVCREASMKCVREYLKNTDQDSKSNGFSSSEEEEFEKIEKIKIRKVNRADFTAAINLKKSNFNRIID